MKQVRDARVSRDSILSALVVDWPLVESVLVDIGGGAREEGT